MECHSAAKTDTLVKHTATGANLRIIMPRERSQTKAHVVRVSEAPEKTNSYSVSEGESVVARTQGTVQERQRRRTRKL